MFAVPGWSVAADGLVIEKAQSKTASSSAKPRRRKRLGAPAADVVTVANVADLYASVVEGKKPQIEQKEKQQQKGKKKKQKRHDSSHEGGSMQTDRPAKKQKSDARCRKEDGDKAHNVDADILPSIKMEIKERTLLKDRAQIKGKKQKLEIQQASDEKEAQVSSLLPQAREPAKLTPLQASMRDKLVSARFRHLNETLYTRPSSEAMQLFQESPDMFDEYHEGFRRQVKVWPENPIDKFLEEIRVRAKTKSVNKRGRSGATYTTLRSQSPLPSTAGTCIIADLGCGDARLAESLQADQTKFRLQVKSYDLQNPNDLVTKADIASLPLEDGTINVAIFCLALMGTNWIDFIEEAYRVLHWRGELWVAEIKSRFNPVRSKARINNSDGNVGHSLGKRKKTPGGKFKGPRDADKEDELFEEPLTVLDEHAENRRRQTDVSAFVKTLRARGFVLQGEPSEAIDLSNGMFVKMHFIKGASPIRGKGLKPHDVPKTKKSAATKYPSMGSINGDESDTDEAAVLKPCVYKIR